MPQKSRTCRVVIVPYPFQGHLNQMMQLATILYSKGFSITVVHPEYNSPEASRYPDFTYVSIPDGLPKGQVNLLDFFGLGMSLNMNCKATFQECMERMLVADSNGSIRCVIYDGFVSYAQDVADHLDIPAINLHTASAASSFAFAVVPQTNPEGCHDIMSEDLAPDLQTLRLKESLYSIKETLNDSLIEWGSCFNGALKKSSAILMNTSDVLEHEALAKACEFFSAPIFPVGPFHKLGPTIHTSLLEEDNNCIPWLNTKAPNSVIYVSYGSMSSIDEKELVEIACGILNSKQPFLWVLRPGLISGSNCHELLPKQFKETVGERGCIVDWAPQKEVLGHPAIGAFWSHCGWNSTMESISEGVPMLCRPFHSDQFLNAKYVSLVWNVGLELGNILERGMIEEAIRKIMLDQEGMKMRQRATEIKNKIEDSIRKNGSTHDSLNELEKFIMSL